ncbi:hypothetical protein [Aestuariibacter salexigens]|uniref:hypothetical protein n=1 Tax=Aestuariibacter salexigens TaxID=226010 RepID=UPI0003F94422|nr:hypothetical protein [Aestuariibacter salexigens]
MKKQIWLGVFLTLLTFNASAALIKVTVNGIFDSDVITTSYVAPDTSIFYTFTFDTDDLNVINVDRFDLTTATVFYRLGSGPLVSFTSYTAFLRGVWGILFPPADPIGQLNINTLIDPIAGAADLKQLNLGTVSFDGGFYGEHRFSGQYTIAEVSEPPMFALLALSPVLLLWSRRRKRTTH